MEEPILEPKECFPELHRALLAKYQDIVSMDREVYTRIAIHKYASMHGRVIGLGFRDAVSLWAFAIAGTDRVNSKLPFTYLLVDESKPQEFVSIVNLLNQCPTMNYSFGHRHLVEPLSTDVLMINVVNIQQSLADELRRWQPFVENYIVFSCMPCRERVKDDVGGVQSVDLGNLAQLWNHIERCIEESTGWSVHELQSSNGLVILRREMSASNNTSLSFGQKNRALPSYDDKVRAEVVIFIPSPVPWEDRRRRVYDQYNREGWNSEQVVLIFIFGTKTGIGLIESVDVSGVVEYPGVKNIFTGCRDMGDEPNNPDDTSGTTCKVYEALKFIARNYASKFVWRGADDSYINLRYFFRVVMPTLPNKRLYYGRLRRSTTTQQDLLVANHPRLQELFGIIQWGQYMSGMGFLFSSDVVDFVASLKIPPHLTWCEDLMVGMWLNPFQIQFMHGGDAFHEQGERPAEIGRDYLLIHRMTNHQWEHIDENGRLY